MDKKTKNNYRTIKLFFCDLEQVNIFYDNQGNHFWDIVHQARAFIFEVHFDLNCYVP